MFKISIKDLGADRFNKSFGVYRSTIIEAEVSALAICRGILKRDDVELHPGTAGEYSIFVERLIVGSLTIQNQY